MPNEEAPQQEENKNNAAESVSVHQIELEALRAQSTEYKDKYLRLLAEMDNMRKRSHKERQEVTQYAVQNIIVDFLTPLDHMENALKCAQKMSDEVKHWALGFQMILTQFKDVLVNNGVKPIDAQGMPFDPHTQEAIEMIDTEEYPEGVVVEECVRGYKMGDKVIRAARVKVSRSPSTKNNSEQKEKE